jgi:threonine-phosphate decarboxylase
VVNQPTIHGGEVYQLAKQLGRPVETLLDFSASMNPLGPPTSVVRAMHDAVNGCQHYPDRHSDELRAQLAQEHTIPEESILVGNGSAELIHILPKALALRHACIVGPTFSEFEHALRLAGVRCTSVNAVSTQRYTPPIEKLHALLDEWKLASARNDRKPGIQRHAVFLCNPNSPTGRRLSPRDLRQMVKRVNQIGCWMIVDEAFMDWCPSYSLIKDLSICPRLIILRSFTKFFAIPGIRLGYLVGEAAVVGSIQKHLPPWSVNHVAQTAGAAGLKDWRFRQRSLRFMQQACAAFIIRLRTIPGVRVMPSQANFVMVELPPGVDSGDIGARLQEEGILVRDCHTFSGVTQPALRLAVRLRRDNHRLVQALKRTLKDV